MIEQLEIGEALARETALLNEASLKRVPFKVWFWQSGQALVAPKRLSTKPNFVRACEALSSKGWPVHTRATGGDVTPQGLGIVNVTLVFTPEGPADISANYRCLCAPMEQTLGSEASRGWNPGAFCDGAYNVQLNGLKFAGTAQRLKKVRGSERSAVLAHALMLMQPPSNDAIDALNLFLELVEEPRRIDLHAHTGLPVGTAQDDFLDRLHAAYSDALA